MATVPDRRRHQVHAHLTDAELDRLDALVADTRLSRSQLLRLGLEHLAPPVRVPVTPLPASLVASAADLTDPGGGDRA